MCYNDVHGVITMKRIGLLLLCIVLLIGCTKEDEVIIEETEEIVEDICTLEEDGVCYEEDAFLIEKDAEIKIGNLPVNLQQAIIDLWDTTYPNHILFPSSFLMRDILNPVNSTYNCDTFRLR